MLIRRTRHVTQVAVEQVGQISELSDLASQGLYSARFRRPQPGNVFHWSSVFLGQNFGPNPHIRMSGKSCACVEVHPFRSQSGCIGCFSPPWAVGISSKYLLLKPGALQGGCRERTSGGEIDPIYHCPSQSSQHPRRKS